jgi:CheY-like chemotaxis protein
VSLELRQAGDQAVISVSDAGIGISDALLPHVFDHFVQSEQALDRSKGGLGLGLTIARGIVELHGGTIGAAHGDGGIGTRITIHLPVMAASADPAGGGTGMDGGPRSTGRVLVIDDNVDAAQLLADVLTHEGYEVRTAPSAEEAFHVMAEFRPAACIVDIGLPGMSGYDFARTLRADTTTRPVFLIAVTGYGQHADREQASSAGFDGHLTKPAEAEAVQALLRSFLKPASGHGTTG